MLFNSANTLKIDYCKNNLNPLVIIFCSVAFSLNMLHKNSLLFSCFGFIGVLIYFSFKIRRYPGLVFFICGPIIIGIIQSGGFCNLSDLDYHYQNLLVQVVKKAENYGIIKSGHQYILWQRMPNEFIIGQNISITGIIKPLKDSQNSFSFDFSSYLNSEKVFKSLVVEKYQLVKTFNFRFLFFQWGKKTNSNEFINFFLWLEPTNSVLKTQLRELNLTYILHLSFLANLYWLKMMINKISVQKTKKFFQHFFNSLFVIYLYLLSFPGFLLRFLLNKILNYLNKKYSWFFNETTKKFLILNFLYFFNAKYILQTGVWYLVVIAIFFTKEVFRNKFGYSRKGNIIKGLIIFIPLQVIFNYRFNFGAPIMALIFLPGFQFLYFLLGLGGGINIHSFGNFGNNLSELFLFGAVKISFSWNFGAVLKIFGIIYFYLLFKTLNGQIFGNRKIYTLLTFFSLIILLALPKIMMQNESFGMLNVGNGSSFLYINKGKNVVVIYDCGSGPGYSANTMADFLKFKGINHVDFVFISHYHQDHFNGLESVKKITHVKNLIDNEVTGLLEGNYKDILFYGGKLENQKDYNDTSLIILLVSGNTKILLVGDLTKTGEYEHLKNANFIEMISKSRIDILQIGHHGSKNASSEIFLSWVNPRFAFISAGIKNNHKFPDLEVIKILNKLKIPFASTHIKISGVFNLQKTSLKSFF